MDNKQHVKTPEGVSKLLEELWLRHKAGLKQPENNVFFVDFPPLTEEEKAAIEAEKKSELCARNFNNQEDDPD